MVLRQKEGCGGVGVYITASCDKGVGVGREFKSHHCVKGGWSGVGVDIHFCATKEGMGSGYQGRYDNYDTFA